MEELKHAIKRIEMVRTLRRINKKVLKQHGFAKYRKYIVKAKQKELRKSVKIVRPA
jgi:hypothetical protein